MACAGRSALLVQSSSARRWIVQALGPGPLLTVKRRKAAAAGNGKHRHCRAPAYLRTLMQLKAVVMTSANPRPSKAALAGPAEPRLDAPITPASLGILGIVGVRRPGLPGLSATWIGCAALGSSRATLLDASRRPILSSVNSIRVSRIAPLRAPSPCGPGQRPFRGLGPGWARAQAMATVTRTLHKNGDRDAHWHSG